MILFCFSEIIRIYLTIFCESNRIEQVLFTILKRFDNLKLSIRTI